MNFSKITKNHFADPEILVGFYVCLRLFQKKKENSNSGDRTNATWCEGPVT